MVGYKSMVGYLNVVNFNSLSENGDLGTALKKLFHAPNQQQEISIEDTFLRKGVLAHRIWFDPGHRPSTDNMLSGSLYSKHASRWKFLCRVAGELIATF